MISICLTLVLFATASAQYEAREKRPIYTPGSGEFCGHAPEPVITVKPEPYYDYKLCQTAFIRCEASGVPTPYVYWIKGRKDLTDKEERLTVTGVGQAILYIDKLSEDDVDYYTCVAENCCGGGKVTAETEIRLSNDFTCNKNDKPQAFYGVIWNFMSWEDAKSFCDDRGASLAIPTSDAENAKMYSTILESVGTDPESKKFAHTNMLWLGISDVQTEGTFLNVYSGQEVTYTNWLPKQPDNWLQYDKVNGQDVVAVDRNSGNWDDSYHFWKRPFVCYCPASDYRKY